MNGVLGEEIFEFAVQLSCKSFVMTQDKCWLLNVLDDIGHAKSLARTGNTEQGLVLKPVIKPLGELLNCIWLVAEGLIVATKLKLSHLTIVPRIRNSICKYFCLLYVVCLGVLSVLLLVESMIR